MCVAIAITFIGNLEQILNYMTYAIWLQRKEIWHLFCRVITVVSERESEKLGGWGYFSVDLRLTILEGDLSFIFLLIIFKSVI